MKQTRKQLKQEMLDNATVTEDGMSYGEIAEILGITKAEVRKLENDALRKLRKPNPWTKKLRAYHNA